MIYRYAQQRYGNKKMARLHFDNENWGADRHNFISIGGPFVNSMRRKSWRETKSLTFS
jgi:hypothetical protein